MTLSTHVLDTARGVPAVDVGVRLEVAGTGGGWLPLAATRTDQDGRARDALGGPLVRGTHRLVFDTGEYFAGQGVKEFFYPEIVVCFTVADPDSHHHVPLLLSPFAYSTYRGS
jgi:5-hydroxyisourate hydrolase